VKYKVIIAIATVLLGFSIQPGFAAETKLAEQLTSIDHRIVAKYKNGQRSEKDLADEFKEIDALLVEHKGDSQDDRAAIVHLKAAVYKLVVKDDKKYDDLLAQIVRDFPDSKLGIELKHKEEIQKMQAGLNEGTQFPDFKEKDVMGKPLSVADYKGKVVLIDFWATWCGPCKAELPNVLKTYGKYHSKGFEIIGISLDDDKSKLTTFTAQNKMTWQQFFDGQGWKNKLAVKYGVEAIPMTYLLGGDGKIIGKNLRGDELEKAVAAALGKK